MSIHNTYIKVYLLISVHEIHESIIVIIMMSTLRSICRKLQIVRSKTVSLSVRIRENTGLQQLIIRIIDPRNNDSRTKRQLFILSKEVVNILVQNQTTHRLQRKDILRPGLGNIKRVKVEPILMIRINGLDKKLPLGVVSSSNRIVKILCSMAVIRSTDLDGFFFQQTFYATCRFPVELHVICFSSFVDQSVGVDTGSLHVTVILWHTDIILKKCEHVQTLGMVGEKVHDSPVFLNVRFRVWFQCVNHVRKFHPVTNKEHWEIVSHQIKVTLQM
ncbi:hypothetical protein Hanom_Chr08g00697461 [Helianthus anomalus]